ARLALRHVRAIVVYDPHLAVDERAADGCQLRRDRTIAYMILRAGETDAAARHFGHSVALRQIAAQQIDGLQHALFGKRRAATIHVTQACQVMPARRLGVENLIEERRYEA